MIAALNKQPRLPKYVIMLTDCDIILGTEFDYGLNQLLEEQLDWLIRQVNKAINRRRDDLKSKRPGAISSSFEPRVIWIKAINRPFCEDVNEKKIRATRAKFNAHLNRALQSERYMYLMEITSIDDMPTNFYNIRGQLSDGGKTQMWREIDTKLKKFDRHEIELRPTSSTAISFTENRRDNNSNSKERGPKSGNNRHY